MRTFILNFDIFIYVSCIS